MYAIDLQNLVENYLLIYGYKDTYHTFQQENIKVKLNEEERKNNDEGIQIDLKNNQSEKIDHPRSQLGIIAQSYLAMANGLGLTPTLAFSSISFGSILDQPCRPPILSFLKDIPIKIKTSIDFLGKYKPKYVRISPATYLSFHLLS